MPFAFSPAFDAFVAPARSRAALWRLAAGTCLAAAAWISAAIALLRAAPGDGPSTLLLYLASFAGLALGTALAAQLLHRRSMASLVGPGGFRLRDFTAAVAVVAALVTVAAGLQAFIAPPARQAAWSDWGRLLPLALPLVLVQTAAEELLFRGYLTQGLAARWRSPLVWAFLPALGFGALHWDTAAYGADAGLAVVAAIVVGLALTDVTAVTGNLSAAIGLHFASNVAALLLVALPGPTAALALYVAPVDAAHPLRAWLLSDIAMTVAAWSAWRLALGLRGGRLHSRDRGSI
jgi:uncharacterized protein